MCRRLPSWGSRLFERKGLGDILLIFIHLLLKAIILFLFVT